MAVLMKGWARLFPNPSFYGWIVVGLGFLCSALSSPGQSFVLALYLEPVMADLGVSRVEISSLYAVATLAAAAFLPLVGSWADRVPSGRFLAATMVLMAFAMLGLAAATTAAALGAAFFFLRLLGQGAIGLATLTVTVRWFRRYRGRALALVGLGYAFGQLVFPGILYGLLDAVGWRASLVALAVGYLLVAAPLMGLFMRDRGPEDEPLDGAESSAAAHAGAPLREEEADLSFSLHVALRMPVFWGLLACVGIPPLVHTALIFHQVALFNDLGWGAAMVPPAFMAFALAGVVMTYATGLLLERFASRTGVALSLGFTTLAVAVGVLPLAPVAGALLYGVTLGLASGANAATNSIVWPDYFGIESLGAVKGVVNAVRNGATALGPPIAAVLASTSGSFGGSLVLFGLLSTAGAAASFWMRNPRNTHPSAAGAPSGVDPRSSTEECAA